MQYAESLTKFVNMLKILKRVPQTSESATRFQNVMEQVLLTIYAYILQL